MVVNVTYTPEQWEELRPDEEYQPWENKTNKLSEMVSEKCYERMFNLEVTNL